MLEPWCEMGTDLRPVELVGISGQAPEELGGMLGALLFRSSQLGQEIADFLASEGFPLPEGPFRLLLMALDDPLVQNLEGGKRYRCRINLYDHLRQWLMTKIDGKAKGFLFMQLGYLLGLFYEETAPDDLSKVCREVVDYATEALGISIRVTLSHTWEGVKNISGAYRAVQDVEQGRDFYTDKLASAYTMGDTLQRLLDREQKAEFEQEFFQTANRVCGSIRAGDRKTVTRYIRDQLMKIAKNSIGLPYPTTLHLTTNRFVSLLQYSLISEDLADWRHLEHMDFSRDLAASTTLAEYLGVAEAMADDLVAHAKQRTEAKHDRLMHEIRAFLETNATDVNIGLTSVAREFHLKPREVAESFRQYYGVSVNDVIHRARVKKAKELILNTNDSIQSIAEAVGYCSLATMYRAFTNVEGVAPGKLRQSRGINM